MRTAALAALAPLACAGLACGGGGPAGPNRIAGSVAGHAFSKLEGATWIGQPSTGSPPVIVFLLEHELDCPSVSSPNWDKAIGDAQVLEIGLGETAARSFSVGVGSAQGYAAYVRGEFNPDADTGTVTITALEPGVRIAGSFEAAFRQDALRGTFDATYCANGVEP